MITKADRCVAFPNLYQHQVQPFELADPERPGHRKILVFFLVDPTYRIPSATDVSPQQKEWLTDLTHQSNVGTRFAMLPVELLDLIVDECEGAMAREEAEAYRKELMGERTIAVKQSNSSFFEVVSTSFSSPLRGVDSTHLRCNRCSICGMWFLYVDLNDVIDNHQM